MPRGDGTGPRGIGRQSGRGAGYCSGYDMPGFANPVPGRGFGMGFGRNAGFVGGGRGRRNCFFTTGLPGWMRFGGYGAGDYAVPTSPMGPTPEMEKQSLRMHVEVLEKELDLIRKRISEMESGPAEGQ
ncbi:MAG: DUF5320 domain-containing protein [Geobacteraceae bacterium]|nr:DUF5320 domain-containing protein [Geobacteraceae bacterium]